MGDNENVGEDVEMEETKVEPLASSPKSSGKKVLSLTLESTGDVIVWEN